VDRNGLAPTRRRMALPAPATIEGAEYGDHLGVLRLDFGGDDDRLQDISWDERLETFHSRKLNFIYQEKKKDGGTSSFFPLENRSARTRDRMVRWICALPPTSCTPLPPEDFTAAQRAGESSGGADDKGWAARMKAGGPDAPLAQAGRAVRVWSQITFTSRMTRMEFCCGRARGRKPKFVALPGRPWVMVCLGRAVVHRDGSRSRS